MVRLVKPLAIAFKGKGPVSLFKRVWTISTRYGLTAAKMDSSLAQLSRILQKFDCKATLPITAVALVRNGAIIQKYQAQGIEFAVHGYRHIDHSQLSLAEQSLYLEQASQIFREQGVNIEGFRCPYLRWNEHTLTALSQAHFSYDSSASLVWDVEENHMTNSYSRALGFYGAQPAAAYPALPSLDVENDLVHIPYCLPDDESLVERLKWRSPAEMDQIWPDMFRQIHQQGELFTLGLHPERTTQCSNALVAALQAVRAAAPAVWCAQLREIAAWWKARYKATVEINSLQDNVLKLVVNGPAGTTMLLRSLEAKTATEPWFNTYQRASEMPCIVRTTGKRPFIGTSPDASSKLVSFLKQQGYIVEMSSSPDLYSFYIGDRSFSHQAERALLTQIETADFPLIRLGCWPDGARSAFNVTGDIDALTFWDYSQRLWER